MELPFAGLHQLCSSLLRHHERLPPPQREALGTAFGLSSGAQPDRFLISSRRSACCPRRLRRHRCCAWSTMLSGSTGSSAQVLAFVARRLEAESVALVFAVREPLESHELAGLAELRLGGLSGTDARELLASVIGAPLDERVRARILAEARGNPLALLELPREFSHARLQGGFVTPSDGELQSRIEASFLGRVQQLTEATRLAVAAGRRRADRRDRAAVAIGGRSRAGCRRDCPGRGGRAARTRHAGRLPPSAPALCDLPGTRRPRTGRPRTARSPPPPTPRPTQIVAPGTSPGRRSGRTRRSPQSSSAQPGGRRRAEDSRRRPRSSAAPRNSRSTARCMPGACWTRPAPSSWRERPRKP